MPRRDKCGVLRRDTWVPPYKVRRSYGADRVVRPYTPCHCEPVRAAKQVPLGYRLARQSVSPQRKGRIPTPVTRSLARNDSAAALMGRRTPRAFVPLRSTAGPRPLRSRKECAEWNVGDAVSYKIARRALQKGRTGVRPLHSILYMTALSATMRCKNTAPACQAPHGHR